jgi:hypothetical protein
MFRGRSKVAPLSARPTPPVTLFQPSRPASPSFLKPLQPLDHTRAVGGDGPIMSRWTDGDAVLPLPPMRGPIMLEIQFAGAMTFLEDAVAVDGIEWRAACPRFATTATQGVSREGRAHAK